VGREITKKGKREPKWGGGGGGGGWGGGGDSPGKKLPGATEKVGNKGGKGWKNEVRGVPVARGQVIRKRLGGDPIGGRWQNKGG